MVLGLAAGVVGKAASGLAKTAGKVQKVAKKIGDPTSKLIDLEKQRVAAGKTPAMDMETGVGPEAIFPTGPGGNPLHYGTHIAMKGKQQVKTRRKATKGKSQNKRYSTKLGKR